jgi:allophanate hydrolase subunit 1
MTLPIKLEKKLIGEPADKSIMLEAEAENCLKYVLDVLKALTNHGYKGIFIPTSRTAPDIISMCRKNGINQENIIFIDGVSEKNITHPVQFEDSSNVTYVDSLNALDRILFVVNRRAKNLKGEKFLMLESVSLPLVYNKKEDFEVFIHRLLTKRKNMGIDLAMVVAEKEVSEDVKLVIRRLCDDVVAI